MGHTINVELIPPIKWKYPKAVGWFDTQNLTIKVLKRPGTITEQTFLHELMHAVFYALNNPLYENEELVDQVGGLLHQAITTAKYPRQPRRTRKGTNGRRQSLRV